MDLIKIKLNELETFCNSAVFQAFPIKPISPLRVKSYIENPHANANDIVLYMYVEGDEVIAFRTFLSDCIGKSKPFAWCSGTWVKADCRGQKLSVKLLHEALSDWDNRLMFTNYAAASEHCYLTTRQFKILKNRTGFRFYLYPNFSEIYKERKHRLKLLFPLLSTATWGISFLKSLLPVNVPKFVELNTLDEDCRKYLWSFSKTFFNRKEIELEWIVKFSWITSDEHNDFVYPFSFSGIDYSLKIVKIFDNDFFVGFFIYTIINSKMKIIYHFLDNDKINLMVNAVTALAQKNKIAYLSILDPLLANRFRKKERCFAFSKQITSHIYSSFDIANEQNLTIFDGDGDNCFT